MNQYFLTSWLKKPQNEENKTNTAINEESCSDPDDPAIPINSSSHLKIKVNLHEENYEVHNLSQSVTCSLPTLSSKLQPILLECSDLGDRTSHPYQPNLDNFPKKQFRKQNRSFSNKYYNEYPWLEYNIVKDAVFCFYFRHFDSTTFSKSEDNFIRSGYNNWKNIAEKLKKHSSSNFHMLNKVKYEQFQVFKKTGNIKEKISTAYKEEVEKIELICYINITQQNISNFSDYFINYFNFTVPTIKNEIIHISSDILRSLIINEIKKCCMFTQMCDESRSQKEEHLSICVRYTNNLTNCERLFWYLLTVLYREILLLTNIIFNTLKKLDLNDVPMIAQAYDGASVMSGHISGVQTRIREKYPEAIYFHCLAHKLNLVLVSPCN